MTEMSRRNSVSVEWKVTRINFVLMVDPGPKKSLRWSLLTCDSVEKVGYFRTDTVKQLCVLMR